MSTRVGVCGILFGLLIVAAPRAQEDPAAVAPEVVQAQEGVLAQLAEAGIEVDLDAGTVSIPAEVNVVMDPLEYVLIYRRGKKHEALFITDVKPSLLNTAFLLLGFEAGTNATYEPIEPAPTPEEVAAGADWVKVFPPEGMPLWMTAAWKQASEGGEQTEHEAAVADLVLDLVTEQPLQDHEWIYLGGRMAPLYRSEPPVFVADFEGNLMSLCYLEPPNHLVTMKHERARDDQVWWRTELSPEPGTPVVLTFHKDKPELVTEREQRLADK